MRKRVVAVVSTAGLVLPGTAGYVLAEGSATTSEGAKPRPGRVHTLALRPVPGTGQTGPAGSAGRASPVMEVPAAGTKPFSLLGVSWDDARAQLEGSVQVRTRSVGGRWSPWRTVEAHADGAPETAGRPGRTVRGATQPVWTGPSDGVQVRVTRTGRALPRGLRVELVDPGETGAALVPEAGAGAGASAVSAAPRPGIVGRAKWGADESLVREAPEYAPDAKVVFVHHSAESNDYSCRQSAALVRAIMLYHVKGNGWNDIGYNFLVDKCGTIFEGRRGGVDRPVVGAHTYGFNTRSAGVAVLGDHTSTAPSGAALSAVAKITAWKLGLHGGDPAGKARLTSSVSDGKYPAGTSVAFNTVSGHRDGFATACPGRMLYDRLGTVRTQAERWLTPVTSLSGMTITGATKTGNSHVTKGTVTLGWRPGAVSRYEVLVDGRIAARPGGMASSARVTLPPGPHTLALRAVNLDGTTVTSPVRRVVTDVAAPVFTGPAALTVRKGTVGAGGATVPVRLGWEVTDNTGVRSLKATSPTAKTFTTSTTFWNAQARPGTSTLWSLTAADVLANTRRSAITRRASLVHETGAVRTGAWKVHRSGSHLGGRAYSSEAKGATARYTFTGRSVGLIFRQGRGLGVAHVYVDGVKVASVDTRAKSASHRRILWTRSWNTSARHTVQIVVAGTSGRPTVITDGIAHLG